MTFYIHISARATEYCRTPPLHLVSHIEIWVYFQADLLFYTIMSCTYWAARRVMRLISVTRKFLGCYIDSLCNRWYSRALSTLTYLSLCLVNKLQNTSPGIVVRVARTLPVTSLLLSLLVTCAQQNITRYFLSFLLLPALSIGLIPVKCTPLLEASVWYHWSVKTC